MIDNLTETIHATLVSVFGVGVLIRGDSGSGKSECALELVSRGHALAADDAVELTCGGSGLYGSAPAALKGLFEIREVGICDIRELFGEASVIDRCKIGVSVELRPSKNTSEKTRIAIEMPWVELMGVKLPHFEISNSSMRPLPLILEAIVKAAGSGTESTLIENYNRSAAG